MRTLPRDKAIEVWGQYWKDMCEEWFKIEVLQDYTGEDDGPSLKAWLAGDKTTSIELMTQGDWPETCKAKHDQGVLLRRIRIIEKSHTPYTEWELEFYKHVNIPSGEQVFLLDKKDTLDLKLPSGDLMMFDNQRIAVCAYDESGRVTSETFYDERDDISQFLELKRVLLARARPV